MHVFKKFPTKTTNIKEVTTINASSYTIPKDFKNSTFMASQRQIQRQDIATQKIGLTKYRNTPFGLVVIDVVFVHFQNDQILLLL